MIPRYSNKPLRRKGTNTHASKKKRAERLLSADQKATRRYTVMEFVREHAPGLPLDKTLPFIHAAVDAGELEGPVPSRATLARWMKIVGEDEALSACAFRDKPRTGRPPRPMDPRAEEYLKNQVLTMTQPSVDALIRTVQRHAEVNGYEVPSRARIIRFVEALNPAEITAAAYGSRAARADSMLKGTLPSTRPHEFWSLDEFGAVTYIKYLHPTLKELVAVKPKIIILADYHGRALLSYHIARPFKDGAETVGFDSTDVIGTILSAALPDLAPAPVRGFAGFLPNQLRWDRHSAHRTLVKELRERGRLDIPNLPGQTPWSRGDIEAIVKTLKNMCAEHDLTGNDHKYLPVGRIVEDPKATRTKAAATLVRERAKVPIAISELMTFEEFDEEFGKVVEAYNNHYHLDLGMSPAAAHFSTLRTQECRSGQDALMLLDPRVLTITQEGLVHQHNWRREKFDVDVPGHRFLVGDQVECRIDPLLRGAFIWTATGSVFVRPKKEVARTVDFVQRVKDQAAEARRYSDTADDARWRDLQAKIGPEGVAKTRHDVEQKLQNGSSGKRGKPAIAVDVPASTTKPPSRKSGARGRPDPKVISLPLVADASAPRTPRGFVRTFHSRIRAV